MSQDDPPFITCELCAAYRVGCQKTLDARFQTIDQKIDGLRNTIVTGLSIATAIISLIVIAINLVR